MTDRAAAPLHPQMVPVVAMVEKSKASPMWQGTPADAREQHNETAALLDAPAAPVLKVEDLVATGDGQPVPVRVYTPRAHDAPLPLLLWFHGGGHVIGNVGTYDSICRRLSLGADAIVVSVDYRLAPEQPFPAAVDDCFAALCWAVAEAAALGADAGRVAVAGDSAGGNLAAVVALLARDANAPRLCAQVLIYPAVAAGPTSESARVYADGYILSRRLVDWFQGHYTAGSALGPERQDWRYAPLLAPSHANLPASLVLLAECDPLHDEGVAYAEVLEAAGTPTTLSEYVGMTHPFFSFAGVVDAAREAMDEVCAFLRNSFSA